MKPESWKHERVNSPSALTSEQVAHLHELQPALIGHWKRTRGHEETAEWIKLGMAGKYGQYVDEHPEASGVDITDAGALEALLQEIEAQEIEKKPTLQ